MRPPFSLGTTLIAGENVHLLDLENKMIRFLFGNNVLLLKEKQFSTIQQRENLNVITWPKGILCKHFMLKNLVAEYFYCMSHDNIVN